ncbi:hypothetical protein N0V93_008233 [Gnomoniopsis smithogilvyi]|uniref:AAA+ ATPase domain-containing protein n=1 Tax=Gnomoniopsis smithogilvyi TaxID=1191159 RepID=A0A9W8YMT6_9PEZI|nr:hypothetical protein N0V93_008233 [Gnomoniopsis smithogilvyi]
MVQHFIDFVRVLDDRMTRLENGSSSRLTEDPDDHSSTNQLVTAGTDSPRDVSETKFAPLSRRLTETDTKATELLRELCPTDESSENHILRVGCHNLSSAVNSNSIAISDPDPEQVEMIFISIKSRAISRFLEAQTTFKFDSDGLIHVTRPFKILIQNAVAIKEQLAKLESKYGTKVVEETTNPGDGSEAKSVSGLMNESDTRVGPALPPQELQGAIEHFRTLVEFMDKYMSSSIQTYNDLRAGKQFKVSFENLWMLFGTNETVYSPKQRGSKTWVWSNIDDCQMSNPVGDLPQAYKIAATFGGAPLMKKSDSGMWETVFPRTSPFVDNRRNSALQFELADSASVDLGVKESYSSFNILCYRLDFDGQEFGTVPGTFIIKPFEGQLDIVSLEVYPLRMRKTSGEPAEDLTERGRAFIQMLHFAHKHYEGLTLGHKRDEINTPVCIDLKLAYQQQPELQPTFTSLSDCKFVTHPRQIMELPNRHQNCEGHKPSWACFSDHFVSYQQKMRSSVKQSVRVAFEDIELNDFREETSRNRLIQTMEEHDLICLLPCAIPAYALLLRKWVKLDIRIIKDIKPGRSWDELVLPDGHRDLVQAMVKHHAVGPQDNTNRPESRFYSDLVEGKGRGCIILLHGAPGVGKTSTAECVAAYTNRPLFPITCGDIGYQPEQVERRLEDLFTLANRWGCVLLLDEADVFLAKRKNDDLKRNALVSVFLRILEYYAGILFLTTNRIGVIDDAFRSRLHLTLFYPNLDADQTKRIWKMNISRVQRHSEERVANGATAIEIDRKGIKLFAKRTFEILNWNGRQIKNAFQSALALAEMEAQNNATDSPKLNAKKFRLIAHASEQFEHYMMETHHGKTEDQLAHREHLRFAPKKPYKGRIDELSSDEDSSESERVSTGKHTKKSKSVSKSKKSSTSKDKSSSEDEEKETVKKSKKKGKKVLQMSDSSEGEEETTRKSAKKSKKHETSDSSEEES